VSADIPSDKSAERQLSKLQAGSSGSGLLNKNIAEDSIRTSAQLSTGSHWTALLDGLDTDADVEPQAKAPSRGLSSGVLRRSVADSADIEYYLHAHGAEQSLDSDEADNGMLGACVQSDSVSAREPLAGGSKTNAASRGSQKTKRLSMHDLSAPAKLKSAATLAEPESNLALAAAAAQPRERRRRSEQLLLARQPKEGGLAGASKVPLASTSSRPVPTLLDEDELENDAALGIYQDTDLGTSFWNVQDPPPSRPATRFKAQVKDINQ
jgi:hypothetical protein